MEKKKIFLVLVFLVLGTLLVAACSSGSETTDDHAEAPPLMITSAVSAIGRVPPLSVCRCRGQI